MMNVQLYAALTLLGILVVFGFCKWREFRKIRQKADRLQAENQAQKATITTQNEEIKNAQVARKNRDRLRATSAHHIDEQLHQRGYFREDDRL